MLSAKENAQKVEFYVSEKKKKQNETKKTELLIQLRSGSLQTNESMRGGSIRSRSGSRHGCQVRRTRKFAEKNMKP